MFTGLVEHTSRISKIVDPSSSSTSTSTENPSAAGFTLTIDDSAPILTDCSVGDSICVNGACLTVTSFGEDWFTVGLAPETLKRTNLGELKVGDKVNCERAMAGHTRFGGHMVQGHVDSTATIISKKPDGESIRYNFQLPADTTLLPYIIEKGYITLDGASLTITEVDDAERSFGIMLIAHSQEKLTLTSKDFGSTINVEVDCVGKYVLGSTERIEGIVERIVERKLKEKGLL
ncbi:riboflavin synthase, alpha subunit [Kwoniella shandongensis]|uniref:Riboflavin synthase n=1 Tax=Kwoniella shandongensis TaxID=1734106 RepID=A0A5M6BZJ8_9TREE|nr:riboflavin synthase, alpha subunit [Kwoniella shandongensis]KAA5526409.1 riboflavin synthase, alpha subunit [Kwoniella shandongensis]